MTAHGRFEQVLTGLWRRASVLAGPQQPVITYLCDAGQGAVLIDPAQDVTPALVEEAGASSVRDILVTHVQEEQLAGWQNFPAARVHVPAGDEYLCEGRQAYEQHITKWPEPWEWETRGDYRGHLAGARNERPAPVQIPLAASLSDGGVCAGLQVVSTPGHGKHAVTLLAEVAGKRVAFCGDLVCGEGKLWNWFDSDWDYGLQAGPRSLLESARRLRALVPDLVCPSHGEVIRDPSTALDLLIQRLETVLRPSPGIGTGPINFPEKNSAARGFRELLPGLHQWRDGNCNVLISRSGHALLVDDGLCYWKPLPERARHHQAVIRDLKQSLGIRKIELVIPTHYHGDHIENIPDLVAVEGAEVVCLDLVADVLEHPERFNLACPLPWYDAGHDCVHVDRRVQSGERIRWREFELEIFHLGGQTHYHLGVSVVVAGGKVLFVGDAIFAGSGLVEPVLCYNKSDPATSGWLFSLERMIERDPGLLVCGHGSALRDPMPVLRRKREAWLKRIRDFEALSARPDLRQFFDPFLAEPA